MVRIRLRETLDDDVRDHVVTDEAAAVHDDGDLAAKGRSGLDRLAKHCAGGDMRNVPFPAELACLRALAGARRAEHHQVQFHAEVSGIRCQVSGVRYQEVSGW